MTMKVNWKNIDELKPGEICGDDIFDPNSFVLLVHNSSILDSKTISFLKKHNVTYVPVKASPSGDISEDMVLEVEEEISAISDGILAPELPLFFSDETYHKSISDFQNIAEELINSGKIKEQEIVNLCNDLVNEVIKTKSYVLNFMTEVTPGFIIKHGLNTAIMAANIAHYLNQPWHHLIQITKAALLHDIGLVYAQGESKNLYEIEDIQKQYSKDYNSRLKLHPIFSVKTIKEIDSKFLDREVEQAILEHHERYDGEGFPFKLRGKKISFYSRIIAVADSYDTLITSVKRKPLMTPYQALKWIVSNTNKIFDPEIVHSFVEISGLYPTGTILKLSNGVIGKVISRGENSVGRPIILTSTGEIELEKEEQLFISGVIGLDKMGDDGTTE